MLFLYLFVIFWIIKWKIDVGINTRDHNYNFICQNTWKLDLQFYCIYLKKIKFTAFFFFTNKFCVCNWFSKSIFRNFLNFNFFTPTLSSLLFLYYLPPLLSFMLVKLLPVKILVKLGLLSLIFTVSCPLHNPLIRLLKRTK